MNAPDRHFFEPLLFKQTIAGVERDMVSFATHPAKYQQIGRAHV